MTAFGAKPQISRVGRTAPAIRRTKALLEVTGLVGESGP
jgi:hypothetical protein